ncbi:MAG: hypothetical protein ACRDPA_16730 [Solirubrobacteraceae bacterium]
MLELERTILTAEMIAPDTGELIRTRVEVRVDPLTGHTSRIVPNRGLMPPNDFDLEAFARENQPRCPFCADRIEQLTPRLPAAIEPDGRIARGEAVLFPNLHAYSSHSCVSVYSPRLHYLPLGQMTERLMADNVAAQAAYARAVMAAEPIRAGRRSTPTTCCRRGARYSTRICKGSSTRGRRRSSAYSRTCRRRDSTHIWTPSVAAVSGSSGPGIACGGWLALPRSRRPSYGHSWSGCRRLRSSTKR